MFAITLKAENTSTRIVVDTGYFASFLEVQFLANRTQVHAICVKIPVNIIKLTIQMKKSTSEYDCRYHQNHNCNGRRLRSLSKNNNISVKDPVSEPGEIKLTAPHSSSSSTRPSHHSE